MVFLNGQKFACATCIKGHRSTTCNHGERPLHEIKKKGRPSIQCTHCKELRKAKQVNARCICGREEGSAAVANGLKRAKSLSYDARLSIPAAIGGEDLLRSFSTQDRSPHNCSDALSSNGGIANCGCRDGIVCPNCLDRASRSMTKPDKGFPSNHQRSAASLDLGKSSMLLFPQDSASPLPFLPHAHGGQAVHSPDGLVSQGMNSTGIYTSGTSPLLVQSLSPSGNSGCDHSPSSSSIGQHNQLQPNLCFDYGSSSDYDSDHYNPTTSYSYFPEALTSYPVSNASDDMEDMDLLNPVDSKKIMDGIMNGTTTLNPMESPSADEIRMLYSALSSFSTASPPSVPAPPTRSYSSPGPSSNGFALSNQSLTFTQITKKGCCGSEKVIDASSSPVSSIPSHSPSAGRSEIGEDELTTRDGCGCAISANLCCCGEHCACPGCLAYPNNNRGMMSTNLDMDMRSSSEGSQQAAPNGITLADSMSLMNNTDTNGNLIAQALNLSAALNLVQDNGQAGLDTLSFDTRQALKQELNGINLSGLDAAQMQHPTILGDNGVLICGCGCGRPTVDCAECFRDMCQFVEARMVKDEVDLETVIRRDAVGRDQPDLNVNMNMAMSMNMSMDMAMNMSDLSNSGFGQAQPNMPQTMSLLTMQSQRSNTNSVVSPSREQQLQNHQQQFAQSNQGTQDESLLQKQRLQQMQLAQQMQQRQSLRRQFREEMEDDQKLQLQLMEQEQMKLQQMHQSMSSLNNLQLDFLDNEDWSFVNEIRTD
ncbi:hypothetical protein BGX27_005542, partial [Mortierella sp. AM989]